MNIKWLFTVPQHSNFGDAALVVLRVVCGLAFMFHGWGKIQTPFSWMGPDAEIPGVFQGLAAVSEFGGGLAWILGAVTPLASFGILCTMSVAVFFHAVQNRDPFVAMAEGEASYEPAAVFWCIALPLIAMGPGKFSVDKQLFGPRG